MKILGYLGILSDVIIQDATSELSGSEQIVDNALLPVEMFQNLAVWSCLIGVAIAVILCIVSFFLAKVRIGSSFLRFSFIFSWIFSFAVYDVGMCIDYSILNLLWNAPMAMIHAFASFLFSSDVSEIHSKLFEDPRFMIFFYSSNALSAFVSALFIIKVFGFNVMQKIKLCFEVIKPSDCKETYVFWGCNEASYNLIESINEHYNGNSKDYRVIVVRTPDKDDDTSDNDIGFNKIFDILSLNKEDFERLQNLGCLIVSSSYCGFSDYSGNGDSDNFDIIGKNLHLKLLSKLLTKKKTTEKIHFLFLSDDEKRNLHDVSVLLTDSTLCEFAGRSANSTNSEDSLHNRGKVIFYCHARFNGVHRVIEDQHYSNNLEVRIIDSSHLSVELLKRNAEVLPVNFVEVEPDATVSSAFNAMVIGFNEVGRDVVRYLYEFGAFVKNGADWDHAVRSEFNLDVVDRDMKDKAGLFIAGAPSIRLSMPFIKGMDKPDALIELQDDDFCSVDFYLKLKEKIRTLNYIVISTDDDELNMSLGVNVFREAIRYREHLDDLCILIRIHNDDDGHFAKIAQYYNKLWAAQKNGDVAGKYRNENVRVSDDYSLPLYIFGIDEDVYTYDNIIDNSVIREAARHRELYTASTENGYVMQVKEENMKWFKDIDDLMQNDSEFHPSYARLMKLRRTQTQDIANSQHSLSKKILMQKALEKNDINSFPWSSLYRLATTVEYKSVSGEKVDPVILRALNVMAQTEHLRWNASHEILGYVYDENGKDEVRLHHNCLTDWEKLDEETRSYDNNVVDVTFGIISPDNKIKTSNL